MKCPHKDTGLEIGNVQKKKSIFVKQQAIEEIVSKLTTVGGFSINTITKSEFIQIFSFVKQIYICKKLTLFKYKFTLINQIL